MATQTIATVDLSIRNPHDTNIELITVFRFILRAHDAWEDFEEGEYEEFQSGGCHYIDTKEAYEDDEENEEALSGYVDELESRVNDLPGFSVESDGNYVTITRRRIEEWEAYSEFDEMIDEQGMVNVFGYEYPPSQVLKNVDPIAYRCAFLDWCGGMGYDFD